MDLEERRGGGVAGRSGEGGNRSQDVLCERIIYFQ